MLADDPENVEANKKAFIAMYELFLVKNEGFMSEDEFFKMMTARQYAALVKYLYSDYEKKSDDLTTEELLLEENQ